MNINYYSDYELEFYIDVLDAFLKDYNDKVDMLENLKSDLVSELKARRV